MKLVDTGFAADFRRSGLTMGEAEAELGLSERQIHRYGRTNSVA